jgi:DNA-directed RNA polymerase specialized sigma subunit
MVKWDNSEFNREIRVNNFEEEWSMSDEEVDEFLEVTSETNRQDIKDWLVDLHRNFDELSCQRLINIRKIYLDLNTHEKVLYDLYFTQMLSLRDIGKKLNLPHMSVWSMVNDLKQKIKNEL